MFSSQDFRIVFTLVTMTISWTVKRELLPRDGLHLALNGINTLLGNILLSLVLIQPHVSCPPYPPLSSFAVFCFLRSFLLSCFNLGLIAFPSSHLCFYFFLHCMLALFIIQRWTLLVLQTLIFLLKTLFSLFETPFQTYPPSSTLEVRYSSFKILFFPFQTLICLLVTSFQTYPPSST